jgi:general secretion pathway protein A
MNKKLLSLYSLKFNPFSPEVPAEALWVPPAVDSFCWRIEQQIGEGGFALGIGDPGTGKSAALRILRARLSAQRDITVGVLTRPQAGLADFYRELGELFGVPLQPHNRWASAKVLREKWHKHIDSSLCRPALLIDEGQECCVPVLSELRLLASVDLDSRSILTIVLAGDSRLGDKLECPELLPLASRIRSRLRTEALSAHHLAECLAHLLKAAGNPKLMGQALVQTLCEHAAGNLRLLMNMANDLLAAASRQELDRLDEKLFFEVFALDPKPAPKRALA